MTIKTVKLATFFISKLTDRMEEIAELQHICIWAIGVHEYIKKVLNAKDEEPTELSSFATALEVYCTAFWSLAKTATTSENESVDETAILSIGRLRETLVQAYKDFINVYTSIATKCGGAIEMSEDMLSEVQNFFREFVRATGDM